MRPLPYVIKRPVKPDYHAAPYSAEPESDAAQIYPDDEPEMRAPYPRSFVERPLVLPDGMAQGSVGTRVPTPARPFVRSRHRCSPCR
jgi:hypothetical protein